jgi:uncharacterized coiled-coil DUF342 family protein
MTIHFTIENTEKLHELHAKIHICKQTIFLNTKSVERRDEYVQDCFKQIGKWHSEIRDLNNKQEELKNQLDNLNNELYELTCNSVPNTCHVMDGTYHD